MFKSWTSSSKQPLLKLKKTGKTFFQKRSCPPKKQIMRQKKRRPSNKFKKLVCVFWAGSTFGSAISHCSIPGFFKRHKDNIFLQSEIMEKENVFFLFATSQKIWVLFFCKPLIFSQFFLTWGKYAESLQIMLPVPTEKKTL